jgi:hypothetical protein
MRPTAVTGVTAGARGASGVRVAGTAALPAFGAVLTSFGVTLPAFGAVLTSFDAVFPVLGADGLAAFGTDDLVVLGADLAVLDLGAVPRRADVPGADASEDDVSRAVAGAPAEVPVSGATAP